MVLYARSSTMTWLAPSPFGVDWAVRKIFMSPSQLITMIQNKAALHSNWTLPVSSWA
jgi:hypothetical protein